MRFSHIFLKIFDLKCQTFILKSILLNCFYRDVFIHKGKKKGNSHLLIRDDAFSSGILNLILMNDTKKTYALYLLTFTLTTRSLNQKNDFCIYKNNQSCHYWNKLVFSVFYKSKYSQMTFFTHAREAFAIRLFKKLHWFIFLRRKIGKK